MKIIVCLLLSLFFWEPAILAQRKLPPKIKERKTIEKRTEEKTEAKEMSYHDLIWDTRQISRKSKRRLTVSPWHIGTAGILPSEQAEISLFSQTRIGFSKKTEWLFRIAEEPFLPNIGLKHCWWNNRRLILSTEHTLYYTYPFLKIIQLTDFKELISDTVTIPQGGAMRNEILFSWLMNPRIEGCSGPFSEKILTLRLGIEFYAGEKSKEMHSFDYIHTLYHTQLLDDKILYYSGLQLDSYFSYRFRYSLNSLFYSVNFTKACAVEANLRITYRISPHVGISALCKGAYIHIGETKKFACLPLLDLTYFIRPGRGVIRGDIFKSKRRR